MLPGPEAFSSAAEGFAQPDKPELCDPTPKPGVEAFRDFVLNELGGRDLGIVRACDIGSPSHHHEGRAWDWGINADDPDEAARAEELLAWLTENDAEMFRRVGLRYMIWNKLFFSSGRPQWRDYDGYQDGQCVRSPCGDPHTGHVHFSFSPQGAMGTTSFFGWLESYTRPPGLPTKQPTQVSGWLAASVGFVAAFASFWLLKDRVQYRVGRR